MAFLHDTEDGQKVRAAIVRQVIDRGAENHQNTKFPLSLGDNELEEIIACDELSDIVEEQHVAEGRGEVDVFVFRDVLDHQGPLNKHGPRHKGSQCNVKALWEDSSETWEPLSKTAKDDPAALNSRQAHQGAWPA